MHARLYWGISFLTLFTAGTLGAVDLDVESARRNYENAAAIASQAEGVFRRDEAAFQSEQGNYLSELSQEKQLKDTLRDRESDLQNLNNQLAALEADIPREDRNVRDLESQLRVLQGRQGHLEQAKQREEREERRSEMELRRAERELQAEQSKPTPDPARVTELTSEKERAKKQHDRNENELRRAEQECRQLENQIRSVSNDLSNAQTRVADLRSRLSAVARAREDQIRNIDSAREDVRRQSDDVRFAQARTEDARRQMNASKADYDRQALVMNQAYGYYQTVQANYTRAYNSMLAASDGLGKSHGKAEADERAPVEGRQVGADTAKAVGQSVGRTEALAREKATGYREARAKPSLDDTSYQAGVAKGRSLANEKAAAEDYPRGYNDSLARTLAAAPATDLTVDQPEEDVVAASGDGVALTAIPKSARTVAEPGFALPSDPAYRLPPAPNKSASIPGPEWKYYVPDCGGVVLAEFEAPCKSAYEAGYRAAFQSAYSLAFNQAYLAQYGVEIRAEYEAARNQAFPAEYKAGVAQGASEQGVLDGFSARLAGARTEQVLAGQAAWETYLDSGYLLRVGTASLEETNGDGLFTPGETTRLNLVVDNLGRKSAPAGSVRAIAQRLEGLTASKTDRALPAFAAQTRTTVKGALVPILSSGRAGASVKAVTAVTGGGTSGSAEASATLHFPLEMQSLVLAKMPAADEAVEAKVKFKNLLATPLPATDVKLSVSPTNTEITPAVVKVPELAAGAETEIPLKVKPSKWVSRAVDVGFRATTSDLGGISGSIVQQFPQKVDVNRWALLTLYDMAGKPVPNGTLEVRAGGRLAFQVLFQFDRSTGRVGPYSVKAAGASDPSIRATSGSTVGSEYGYAGPGTKYTTTFSYDIPAALKGKSVWVAIGLKEAGRDSQFLQVWADVK